MDYKPTTSHRPVLSQEVIAALRVHPKDTIVDATINGAGHGVLIASALGREGLLVGIDQDKDALERARERLEDAQCKIKLILGNFRNLKELLGKHGITEASGILFDLGLSSDQISPPGGAVGRGFTFAKDEPLLMTFGKDPTEEDLTAEEIVNTWDQEHIADVIFGYGEERFARRIAKAIAVARKEQPIKTTKALVSVIEKAVPRWYRFGRRIHPATKTFQALRIAVNDEISALREGLSEGIELLGKGGRVAVISFHSVEDRVVKTMFAERSRKGKGQVVTKKPIMAQYAQVKENPRARSAKLRVFEKT